MYGVWGFISCLVPYGLHFFKTQIAHSVTGNADRGKTTWITAKENLMKGIVFTEFIEMVESTFGFETADAIITDADSASGGAYTSVGQYPDQELIELVLALSRRTGTAPSDLLKAFGSHLFARFALTFPELIKSADTAFDLLSEINDHIHVEVRKLYPTAKLPRLDCESKDDRTLLIQYRSHRPLGDFAEGMIQGVIDYFNERISIDRHDLDPTKKAVEFTLARSS